MPFFSKNIRQLERDVNRISLAVRQAQWMNALAVFRLNGLTTIEQISETEETFSYTPQERNIILGDASPASCKSEPMIVDSAMGETMKGFTIQHEAAYEVCLKDCKEEATLQMKVEQGEFNTAVVLLNHLYNKFWYGNPELMQFGLLNHPLTEIIESPNDGSDGSSSFEFKTNNQVMKELRSASKYMINPVFISGEVAFENSFGNADAGSNQSGCNTRSECIEGLLSKQTNINFNGGIQFMPELDNREEFGGKNIMLIYDADSMSMTSSGAIYLSAANVNSKVVQANRIINTGGLKIKHSGAVKVIVGV